MKEQIKEHWQKAKEWWASLALREKQAVAAGGSVLGLFLIYQLMWSPIVDAAANMRQRINTQQKTLAWMQAADKELAKLEGQSQERSKTTSPVALLAILQKQVNQAGLDQAMTQLKQSSNDSIEMHFQKVPFDKLVRLLLAAVKEHGVVITHMAAVADATPGIVNADVVLRLG